MRLHRVPVPHKSVRLIVPIRAIAAARCAAKACQKEPEEAVARGTYPDRPHLPGPWCRWPTDAVPSPHGNEGRCSQYKLSSEIDCWFLLVVEKRKSGRGRRGPSVTLATLHREKDYANG